MRRKGAKYLLIILIVACAFCTTANAQVDYAHNINIDNGLPSNLVYATLKDQYGYLWASTPDGVVRYNGYEIKNFTMSDGLPTNDIWGMQEDKSGRIWLSSISNGFGYILNEKYHACRLPQMGNVFYPLQVSPYKNGIMCINNGAPIDKDMCLWIGQKDTVYNIKLPEPSSALSGAPPTARNGHWIFTAQHNNPIMIYNARVYDVVIEDKQAQLKYKFPFRDTLYCKEFNQVSDFVLDDFLIYSQHLPVMYGIHCMNLGNGSVDTINVGSYTDGEPIESMYIKSVSNKTNSFFISTRHFTLEFKTGPHIKFISKWETEKFYGGLYNSETKTSRVFDDAFWGRCILTSSSGLYFNHNVKNKFISAPDIKLNGYQLVGAGNGLCFWWDKSTGTLLTMSSTRPARYLKFNELHDIRKIIPYQGDTFLVLGGSKSNSIAWLDIRSNSVISRMPTLDFGMIYSGLSYGQHNYFFVGQYGFNSLSISEAGKELMDSVVKIDPSRYKAMEYDPTRKNIWVYNQDKILIYNVEKKQDNILINEQLSALGTRKVEQVAIDNTYGNIFFKGDDKVVLYDAEKKSYTYLFENINVKKAILSIYNGNIILAGRFGILFSKVLGPQKVSGYLLYPNVKNIAYKHVYSMVPLGNKILLNTDKGALWIDIPGDSVVVSANSSNDVQYKFLAYYKDSVFKIVSGDTIILDQKNLRLQFDVINPTGNGALKYTYTLSGSNIKRELNSNELTLPGILIPGKYYTLSVWANDDVWRSNAIVIHIFVRPYWWQLFFQSKWFWVCFVVVVLVLFALVIYISNRIITKNQVKRNLRLGLELKSVYAQINPHFIFNTLGTAMFFVKEEKMKDAYDHLAKFSRLLRAYIKSARNKYITIAAEIENLNTYIQLQQVRFEDKFDYKITVAANDNIGNIEIPALLLQPIVENAIDHGLFHKAGKGFLKIEFEKGQSANEIHCIIDDDGIGRENAKLLARQSLIKTESYGERLIDDLVSVFNKYENINISIKYIDKVAPLTGTTVIIKIKYPKNER